MADEKLSIIDHLEELRRCLMLCMLAVGLLFPLGFWLSGPGLDWLVGRFCPGVVLHTFAIHELFFLRMKMGVALAVTGAFPVIAWQVWRFVAPGLYTHERQYISRYVFVSTFLFLVGALFALFVVYPTVLRFFQAMQTDHLNNTWGVASFVGMASMMMLGFGIMFQLPIVVYVLAVTELVSLETMSQARPVVVVVLLMMSAILTPPDVISQLMMGVPSYLLFEISLLVSRRSVKRKVADRKRHEEEERLREEEEERREREEEAAYRAAHPEEVAAEAAASEDDAEPDDDYSDYYDEFHDESYNYADQQEEPKKKPGKWQVRGLRRDRRFMSQAMRKRSPRRRK